VLPVLIEDGGGEITTSASVAVVAVERLGGGERRVVGGEGRRWRATRAPFGVGAGRVNEGRLDGLDALREVHGGAFLQGLRRGALLSNCARWLGRRLVRF
jgi:hypothetical protein